MKKHLLHLILTLTIVLPSIAQIQQLTQKPDCKIANILTSKDTIVVDSLISTAGEFINEVDPNSCMEQEFSSSWFKWTCTKSGNLAFTIIPLNVKDDIDFIVFESNQNDCSNKIEIRCMASGETILPDSVPPYNCLGNTGLSLTADDVIEIPGCQSGDDNFVKALDMIKDKTYTMVVNNFSSSGLGYKIAFDGDGEIGETSAVSIDKDCTKLLTSNVISDALYINSCKKFSKLNIYDFSGKLEFSTINADTRINVNHLPRGLHFISSFDTENNLMETEKFYVSW